MYEINILQYSKQNKAEEASSALPAFSLRSPRCVSNAKSNRRTSHRHVGHANGPRRCWCEEIFWTKEGLSNNMVNAVIETTRSFPEWKASF